MPKQPARRIETAPQTHTKAGLYKTLNAWLRAMVLRDLGRGSTVVRVACSLAYYAARSDSVSEYLKTGRLVAYPGQARLARELGVSKVSITSAVGTLESAGFITGIRKRGAANVYVIIPQRAATALSDETGQVSLSGPTDESGQVSLSKVDKLSPRNRTRKLVRNISPKGEGDKKRSLREGDEGARFGKRGAVRSLGRRTSAPRPSAPKKKTPPMQKLTVETVSDGVIYGQVDLDWFRRVSDRKVLRYADLAGQERADANYIRAAWERERGKLSSWKR